MLRHHSHVVLVTLGGPEVVMWCTCMSCVALSQLGHEVTIEHRLSHLNLLVLIHFVRAVAAGAKAADSGLIEHLIFGSLSVYIRKHVVDS